MSIIDIVVIQNTYGRSEGRPAFVPPSLPWFLGVDTCPGNVPRPTFSCVDAWVDVIAEGVPVVVPQPILVRGPFGRYVVVQRPTAVIPAPIAADIQIANLRTFVRLKVGPTWVKVQDIANFPLVGEHWAADFSAVSRNILWIQSRRPDGSYIIRTAPRGFAARAHLSARGVFVPATVDAVFVQADVRTVSPNAQFLARVGADWVVDRFGFTRLKAGSSNWVKITSAWRTIGFHSLPNSVLQNIPPDTGDLAGQPIGGYVVVPYTAGAVHFDNSTPDTTYLKTLSLNSFDTGMFTWSGWFKTSTLGIVTRTLWQSDPVNNNTYARFTPADTGKITVGIDDDSSNSFSIIRNTGANANLVNGAWHHVLFSIEANRTPKRFKMYVDDVDVGQDIAPVGPLFTFQTAGKPFYVGSDGSGDSFTGDMADLWIAPGRSLLDASGDIPVATRRLFISSAGKPVDLGGAKTTLGIPDVLFTGGASAFATNRGHGGAFSLHGSLTDASTSPSS